MLKLRKCLSVILAVMMILTSVAVFADEQTETTEATEITETAVTPDVEVEFSDVDENSVIGKAVSELVPFGIISGYPDGTFKPEANITRAEVAKMIITFLNLQNIAIDGVPTGFSDVDDTNHWAQKFIRLAIDRKIVNGYTDGTFKPDDPVKYSEAVKMIVCALNYGELAANRTPEGAAWYTGYITQAAELGILKNVTTTDKEEYASRGVVAVLTSNSLDVKVASTGTTQDGSGVSVAPGGTSAREEYQDTQKLEGIVVSCKQTAIGGYDATSATTYVGILNTKGKVQICIAPNKIDAIDYLGYSVTVNLQDNYNGSEPLISTITKTKRNSVSVADASQIQSITSSEIMYWESDTATSLSEVSFENDMSVIYNGEYLGNSAGDYMAYLLGMKAGKITFISNDGDDSADVAFVDDCKIYAVSSSGTDSQTKLKKIYALYGGGEFIVPDKGRYITIDNKGVNVTDPKNFTVSKYDIINLYESVEGNVFNMTVTRNKKSGKVTALSGSTITIGGVEYQYAYNFAEYTGSDKPEFKVGNNATIYLDASGKIAAAEKVSAAEGTNVYVGYLIKAVEGEGINSQAQVRVFGMSTGVKGERIYKIADKVKINGENCNTKSEFVSLLKASAEKANEFNPIGNIPEFGQIIRYTTNKNGEIDSIEIHRELEDGEDISDAIVQSLPYREDTDGSYTGGEFKYVSGRKFLNADLGTAIQLDPATPVLVIPLEEVKSGNEVIGYKAEEIDKYKNTTYSYFVANRNYKIEAWCMDDTNTPKYIICYANSLSAAIEDNANIFFANANAYESTEADGADYKLIDKVDGFNFKTGASASTLKSENVEVQGATKYTSTLASEVQAGEIFRYSVDDGYVNNIEMIFEIVDGKPVLFGNNGSNALAPLASDEFSEAKKTRDVAFDRTSLSGESATFESSTNRVVYGTVLGKNGGDGEKRIAITNTLLTDECFNENDLNTFALSSSAKIFVIDLKATEYDKVVNEDISFDEISTYKEIKAADGDVNEAAQVLMFVASGTVRTIAIIRY